MKTWKPAYDLAAAKELVRNRLYRVSGRVYRFIRNHWDDDPNQTIEEVFAAARPGDFRKALMLDALPDVAADVYRVECGGEEWYLKFFIDDDGEAFVMVLSCNIDGFAH